MPHTSSSGTSQRHDATAFHVLILTFMRFFWGSGGDALRFLFYFFGGEAVGLVRRCNVAGWRDLMGEALQRDQGWRETHTQTSPPDVILRSNII